MTKLFNGSTLLLVLLVLSSCFPSYEKGSGNLITKTYSFDEFDMLDISGIGDVYVRQSDTFNLSIKTDENILDKLDVKVNHRCLTIKMKHGILNPTELKIYITLPMLMEVGISGAVNLFGVGPFKSDNLDISQSGSSHLALKLYTKSLHIQSSGAASIDLSGYATDLKLKFSGSSELKGADLKIENADLRISGAGIVNLHVIKRLNAHVNGVAKVFYTGEPAVNSSINGTAIVKSVN